MCRYFDNGTLRAIRIGLYLQQTRTGTIWPSHMQDFNLEAEWHFFAMSHGKGLFDGLGVQSNMKQQEPVSLRAKYKQHFSSMNGPRRPYHPFSFSMLTWVNMKLRSISFKILLKLL